LIGSSRAEIGGKKKRGIIVPNRVGRGRGMRKGNTHSVVITTRIRNDSSGKRKGSVTKVKENVVESSMHLVGGRMIGEKGTGSTSQSSIRERGESRTKVWPGMKTLSRRGRHSISVRIWVGVPVPYKKIKGREMQRILTKFVKETGAFRLIGVGVNISDSK